MSLETDAVASATIELLEGRLHRLEYLLTGDSQWTGQQRVASPPATAEDTVTRRLTHLEKTLNDLVQSNSAVRDLLRLRKHLSDF